MAIPSEEIAQVRAATDIVGLISEEVALKKSGNRWTGLCPFHGEKTPSFSVNGEEGLFYCFGCQKSGDAISWVRERQGLDFVDAIRLLADRAGIELHEDEGGPDRKERGQLLDAMERAVEFYHQRLLTAPDGAAARSYLRSRGYDGEVVRATFKPTQLAFQMGQATQIHSGGLLRATPHCVRAAGGAAAAGIARNAFAVFMQPNWDAAMDAPGGAKGDALGVAQHRDGMTFGEFAHAMLTTYH